MEKLYFLVTGQDTWTQKDPHQFLHHYFIENGAFTTCFLIAIVVAILGLLIYYGWIGNVSNRLSTLPTWIVTFIVVGLITLAVTQVVVIGSLDNQTGFFDDVTQHAQELRQSVSNNALTQFDTEVNNIRNTMHNGCDVVYVLDLWNMFISLFIFFLLSLGVKRFTRYCIAIPF